MTGKKKRGPRLPFGQLTGVWSELCQTYRGQKDGTIQSEDAKARVYTLSMMLGVVDRLLEQRALDEMRNEIAALRGAMAAGDAVVSTTATRGALSGRRADA